MELNKQLSKESGLNLDELRHPSMQSKYCLPTECRLHPENGRIVYARALRLRNSWDSEVRSWKLFLFHDESEMPTAGPVAGKGRALVEKIRTVTSRGARLLERLSSTPTFKHSRIPLAKFKYDDRFQMES